MISRSRDGTALSWTERGTGVPVLLIHGFASTMARNWIDTGWVDALVAAGYRVIAFDQRGHGDSEARYDPAAYAPERFVEDATSVLDAAGVERSVVFGYSMGARTALEVALTRRARTIGLVLSGMGSNFRDLGSSDPFERELVAEALEADDPGALPKAALFYRRFAEQTGQDRRALAACWRRPFRLVTEAELATLALPALVVVGDQDEVAGDATPLARAIPGAKLVTLAGKNHMNAVGARAHRTAVLEFLAALARGERVT